MSETSEMIVRLERNPRGGAADIRVERIGTVIMDGCQPSWPAGAGTNF